MKQPALLWQRHGHEGTTVDGVLGEVLVSRQPVVDAKLEVVVYELRYRDEAAAQRGSVR